MREFDLPHLKIRQMKAKKLWVSFSEQLLKKLVGGNVLLPPTLYMGLLCLFKAYQMSLFFLLQSAQRILQFSGIVLPPLLQGVI